MPKLRWLDHLLGLSLLFNKENHKALYWASRYQSIHRLITHCRPKQFIVNNIYKVVEV